MSIAGDTRDRLVGDVVVALQGLIGIVGGIDDCKDEPVCSVIRDGRFYDIYVRPGPPVSDATVCVNCGTPIHINDDDEWEHSMECPVDTPCYDGNQGPTP